MKLLETLVSEAQAGSREAFGEIVKRFQDMAFAVAYATVGESHLAEDVAQEAFITAYCHLDNLSEPAAFPGWFRTIVIRQGQRTRRGKQFSKVPFEAALTVSAPGMDLTTLAELRETQTLVQAALQALPEHERQMILLFYLADYSQKEIASLLSLQLATIKSRLHRARNRLRERMIKMIQDSLQPQRPSKDETFANQVMSFIRAVEEGETVQVQSLLQNYPELTDTAGVARYSPRTLRPLHYACSYGHQEVVELLLARGADINAKASESWAPIHYAVRGGHLALAEFLVSQGAVVDIFAAAGLGNLTRVQSFLSQEPALALVRGPSGATPLHFASVTAIASLLLDQGAEIEARDEEDLTPLAWSARYPEVSLFLLSRGAKAGDIFLACEVGDIESVKTLVGAEPELVHAKNHQGSTPLHAAASRGQVAIATLLLSHGAEVDARTESGAVTPLHEAASWGHIEVVRLLLEHGADSTAKDTQFNSTPLGWAKFFKQAAVEAALSGNESQLGVDDV